MEITTKELDLALSLVFVIAIYCSLTCGIIFRVRLKKSEYKKLKKFVHAVTVCNWIIVGLFCVSVIVCVYYFAAQAAVRESSAALISMLIALARIALIILIFLGDIRRMSLKLEKKRAEQLAEPEG